MKSATLPLLCTCALSAMSAAGISHWWSVTQFAAAMDAGLQRPTSSHTTPLTIPLPPAIAATPGAPSPAPSAAQQAFYQALISKMEGIQTQNRDLLDQLAETNRDLMKLEFRVDTHSESFRPLPVSEDRPYTSVEDEPGVLPPRAEPVVIPSQQ